MEAEELLLISHVNTRSNFSSGEYLFTCTVANASTYLVREMAV